ncbi:MAG: hypothetical protein QXD72_01060 [Candidatus Aenigmatarchaeota archaeon]
MVNERIYDERFLEELFTRIRKERFGSDLDDPFSGILTKCDIRFFSRRVRINSKTLKELLIRTNNDKSFVWDDKEIRTLITGNKIEAENFIAVRPYFTANYKEYEYFDINSGKRLITTKKLFSNEETLKNCI